ncbi:hypothetical protein ABPG72_014305 [Tetrahymena utriculariae]
MSNNFEQTEQYWINSHVCQQEETDQMQALSQAQFDIKQYEYIKQKLQQRKQNNKCQSTSTSEQSTNTCNITDQQLQRNLDYLETFVCMDEKKPLLKLKKPLRQKNSIRKITNDVEGENINSSQCKTQSTSSEFMSFINANKTDLKLKKKILSPQQQFKRTIIGMSDKSEKQIQDIQFILNKFNVGIKMTQKQKKLNYKKSIIK